MPSEIAKASNGININIKNNACIYFINELKYKKKNIIKGGRNEKCVCN